MDAPGDTASLSSPAEAPAGSEAPERLTVTIVEEDGDWSWLGSPGEAIQQAAAALARHRCIQLTPRSEASVVLGSDTLVRRLNRTYRGKDAPTNVLSFPCQRPPGAAAEVGTHLGDIVLAAETVRLEAAASGIEPKHHLQHLVVHGLLHLLGFDHQGDAAAEEMEGLEAQILAHIGVADPYATPAAS